MCVWASVFVCVDACSQSIPLTAIWPNLIHLSLVHCACPSHLWLPLPCISCGSSNTAVLDCVCNYTGRPAFFELWISNSLCVSFKKGGTKAARGIAHKFGAKWGFFPFFFLSSMLPPSKVWQASQRYQERDRDRNSARDIQSLQHQSACLPACLPDSVCRKVHFIILSSENKTLWDEALKWE